MNKAAPTNQPYAMVLGLTQDAGYPQAGCAKDCCKAAWTDPTKRRFPVCLAIVDPVENQTWLLEATPNIKEQLYLLNSTAGYENSRLPNGIFLTHGHIGHYTGLMQLGREIMGAKQTPVYAMPRMMTFLKNNAPWNQLVEFKNILLVPIQNNESIVLHRHLRITPFLVPHRDEFTETVGYNIQSKNTSILFIPDIDKWHKWETDIRSLIPKVDFAFVDGTFYKDGEISGSTMNKVPHPFIEESMQTFADLPPKEKNKIHFFHFNHTNPVLQKNSPERQAVTAEGFSIAEQRQIILL